MSHAAARTMISGPQTRFSIGDLVCFNDSTSVNAHGEVVALLDDDYVRVRWRDLPGTTSHRSHCLTLVTAAADQAGDHTQLLRALDTLDPSAGEKP